MTATGSFQAFGPKHNTNFATMRKFAASPGDRVSIGGYVEVSRDQSWVIVRVTYFDAGGTQLGTNDPYNVNGVDADTPTNIFGTATSGAPASTAWASVEVQYRGNTQSGDTIDVWDFYALAHGATELASFIPSLRIVNDVDLRAKFAADDATPASAQSLLHMRSGNNGYAMTLGTGGELVVYHGTGSATRQETSSGLDIDDGEIVEVRSTLDISAGTWTHYKNGTQFDQSTGFATAAGSPHAAALAAAADTGGSSGNFDGNVYYAEVRDGIGGPVVARFDAQQAWQAAN